MSKQDAQKARSSYHSSETRRESNMSPSQNLTVNWNNVPTRTIAAGGVEFAYRTLGTNHPGTPVVFLIHLGAVLDNWVLVLT